MKRINQSAYRQSKWAILALLLFCKTGLATPAQDSVLITISVSNTPIEQVFRSIEQQTNYTVLYNTRIVNPAEKVSINVKRASLERTMAEVLRGKDLNWSIKGSGILIIPRREQNGGAVEDSITRSIISGVVRQEDTNVPLAGVSVLNKNTGKGAITDASGAFKLLAGRGDMLQLSSVGQSAKVVRVNGVEGEMMVKMVREVQVTKEVEVLSTGYQTLSPERTTGSFNYIGKELLERKVSTDILSRIDGISPSILFDKRNKNNATSIQIRGLYTLMANSQPLIVVDKFPYEGDINDINPNDVESITILKDAGASSIWGAKAGNGVIVITTKKGAANTPLQLSLNMNTTFTQKPDLYALPQMPVSDYIEVEKFLFEKGAYTGYIDAFDQPALSEVINILTKQKNGQITADEANVQLEKLKRYDVRRDFDKYIYQTGIAQQYSMTLNGGAKNVKYFFSGGFDKNNANLVGNVNQRITFRNNTSIQATKKLQVDIGIFYTQNQNKNNSLGDYGNEYYSRSARILLPYAKLADDAGNPLNLDTKFRSSFTDTVGGGKLPSWTFNPLKEMDYADNEYTSQSLTGDLGLKYNLFGNFSLDLSYRYQTGNSRTDRNYSSSTFFTRDLINTFAQTGGTTVKYIVPNGGILDLSNGKSESHSLRGGFSFNKNINGIHLINAIAGAELRQAQTQTNYGRTYGYDDNLQAAAKVDLVNQYPTYFGFNSQIPYQGGFSKTLNRFTATYANASYTYNNRYTVSGSFRKDASNLFGVKANSKGSPFWSAGGAWILSNENFYQLAAIPYLRVRGTYGYNGNTGPVIALTTINNLPATGQVTNIPYASIRNPPNPDLRWERISTLNIALDYQLKNNRLSGSIDFYIKKTTDMLGIEILDPTTGLSSITSNSGNMAGKGADVVINSINIKKGEFSWNTTLNFSYATYKITKYLGTLSLNNSYITNGGNALALEGYNPFLVVSYKWGGLDAKGDPRGYINGKITKNYDSLTSKIPFNEQVLSGVALPPYFGNILNTFRWKGITVSANITYRLGHVFRISTIDYNELINSTSMHADYVQRWQKPGDELSTNVPAFLYPNPSGRDGFYKNSEITIRKASNIRLTDVQVSYNPFEGKATSHNQVVKSLNVYAYLNNINWFLYKGSDDSFDPDIPNSLPNPLNVSLGARINF